MQKMGIEFIKTHFLLVVYIQAHRGASLLWCVLASGCRFQDVSLFPAQLLEAGAFHSLRNLSLVDEVVESGTADIEQLASLIDTDVWVVDSIEQLIDLHLLFLCDVGIAGVDVVK